MAVISSILTALGAIGTSLAGAFGGSVVGGTVAGATIAGTAGATAGLSAAAAVGIGAVAAVGVIGTVTTGLVTQYQSSRASAKAQKAQAAALEKLSENTGTLDVSKTTSQLQDNSRVKRTLSSLRVSLLPQTVNNEQVTKNVYGVDTNNVVSQTQNMTGLNIATA